jgi:hypothetical protein
MAGGTVQMGQIQPACFGWPSHFGLVAHHGRTGAGRSANGGAGGGPAGFGLPATGVAKEGRLGSSATRHTRLGVEKGVLARRTSSVATCGRPEGNSGGGGVRGRWSMARGEQRWYMTARCSLRRRGAQWGTGGGDTWWLDGGRTR